jgi:hypothetical protein
MTTVINGMVVESVERVPAAGAELEPVPFHPSHNPATTTTTGKEEAVRPSVTFTFE